MVGATNHWFKFHSEWYGVWRKDCTIGTETSYSTWTPLLLAGELIAPPSLTPFGLATSSDGFEFEKLRINLYCCAGSVTYAIFDSIFVFKFISTQKVFPGKYVQALETVYMFMFVVQRKEPTNWNARHDGTHGTICRTVCSYNDGQCRTNRNHPRRHRKCWPRNILLDVRNWKTPDTIQAHKSYTLGVEGWTGVRACE